MENGNPRRFDVDEKKKQAARAAGAWWAERLSDEFGHSRAAFAASVQKHVLQELQGECHWDWWGERKDEKGHDGRCFTENDYDPHYCLIPALREAFPEVPAWRLRSALPTKTSLDITPEVLKPKEGYGNWTEDIPVIGSEYRTVWPEVAASKEPAP